MSRRPTQTPPGEARSGPAGALLNWLADWRKRHRNTVNLHLHLLGIPACFLAAPVLLLLRQWLPAAVLFVVGYLLQFLGHVVEGNRSGEEMLVRRLLGKGPRK